MTKTLLRLQFERIALSLVGSLWCATIGRAASSNEALQFNKLDEWRWSDREEW